jgi:hypothetical protein
VTPKPGKRGHSERSPSDQEHQNIAIFAALQSLPPPSPVRDAGRAGAPPLIQALPFSLLILTLPPLTILTLFLFQFLTILVEETTFSSMHSTPFPTSPSPTKTVTTTLPCQPSLIHSHARLFPRASLSSPPRPRRHLPAQTRPRPPTSPASVPSPSPSDGIDEDEEPNHHQPSTPPPYEPTVWHRGDKHSCPLCDDSNVLYPNRGALVRHLRVTHCFGGALCGNSSLLTMHKIFTCSLCHCIYVGSLENHQLSCKKPSTHSDLSQLFRTFVSSRSEVERVFLSPFILNTSFADLKANAVTKVRPIAVMDTYIRLISKAISCFDLTSVSQYLKPFQCARRDARRDARRPLSHSGSSRGPYTDQARCEKRFNSVSREGIRAALLAAGASPRMIQYFNALYGTVGKVISRGPATNQATTGVLQGDPLSLLFFCLSIAPALKQASAKLGSSPS